MASEKHEPKKGKSAEPSANGHFVAPSIQLPKGGGAIKSIDEKFSVNSINGTGSFSLPVPVADARGFSPSLGLAYSSGAGNGIFGLGWNIGIAAIKRKTDKELPRYNDAEDSDTFILSQAEDLVPKLVKPGGKWEKEERDSDDGFFRIRFYRPRIESGFARIERWTNKTNGSIHWRTITRDNTTTIYGLHASAQVHDPADDKKIFEWLIEFSYDDKGHTIQYEYKTEDHTGLSASELHERNRAYGISPFTNRYLKRVKYGNVQPFKQHTDPWPSQYLFENVLDYGEHDPALPPFNETGVWEYRADAFSEYRPGFEVRTCRLCRRIILYTRFAEYNAPVKTISFAYDDNGQDGFRFLRSATITGYTKHDDGTYTHKSLPPFAFEYQEHEWNAEIKSIGRDALEHAPAGINEPLYQWIDLFGEGLSGLLTEQGNNWYYKHNLGEGNFTAARQLDTKPSFGGLGSQVKLMDVEGDSLKQLVHDSLAPKGFFELTEENEWLPFRAFTENLNINLSDPNVKMLDLDGDGKSDLLVAEGEIFTWYASKGKKGFSSAEHIPRASDEEKGPCVVFSDGTQTIFVADMSGDGMSDIVRIRNGEVCYWPNLGFGRFGAKVNMSHSPVFDHPDQFDAKLVRLADIDGSGTTDIIYLGKNTFRVWMNQQGNRFVESPYTIDPFPEINNMMQVSVLDLLGTGTSCIVWNCAYPHAADRPLQYIDLMNSRKPHLMTAYKNNMGKELKMEYTPSTRFYIADKLAGKPWVTRLPFPVQCVSKIISIDRIMKLRFASTFSYHHGYYDTEEREFRGFGRAEQIDSERIDHFVKESGGMMNNIVESDLHQHPVKTVSWFHTGAWKGNQRILNQFAHEYYQNPVAPEYHLPEPELEAELTGAECVEALRACKGTALRKEIYALDGTGDETKPYTVEQHNILIRMLQPASINKHAVFFTHESEAVSYHYERNPADPRIGHTMVLEIDEHWGLSKRSVSIGYPRRPPAMGMPPHPPEQTQLLIAYTEHQFTPAIDTSIAYRGPAEYAKKVFEVPGLVPGPSGFFNRITLAQDCASATAIDYHETPVAGQKRLVSFTRTQFCDDDTVTPLAFGLQDSKGLISKSFQAALNRPMLGWFNTHITAVDLENLLTDPLKGGYVFADNYFWIPSGTVNYEAAHFYQSTEFTDPFGKKTKIKYDTAYRFFVEETEDSLHNKTRLLKFNWRVQTVALIEDINSNQAAARFDELGMVRQTFVIGKPGVDKGDVFDETKTEGSPLDQPTVIIDYSIDEWYNQSSAPGFDPEVFYKPKPNFVRTRARETHYHADPLHNTKWQESYSYSDGGGHEILKKAQAEPGKALKVNPDGTVTPVPHADPRWVGNGRVILNNKGSTVKKYYPYFAVDHGFDDEKEMAELGFTSIIEHDPLSRSVRVDDPNGTYTKIEFTPWVEFDYDKNDTVRYPDCKWYSDRGSPDPMGAEPNDPEERAAWLAAKHFNTPSAKYSDTLGRTWLTETDNGAAGKYRQRVLIDIEGHEKIVYDALNRPVDQYWNDMIGNKIRQHSIDAGTRWQLTDVLSKPLVTWDERGHKMTFDYDEHHRPLAAYVTQGVITKMVDRMIYGEDAPPAADPVGNKLKGRIYKHYDQSGVLTNLAYDFKSNLLSTTHEYTEKYNQLIDWSVIGAVSIIPEVYTSSTEYDALNRPVRMVSPHTAALVPSEIFPKYNEANLLNSVDVKLRGALPLVSFVENVNYNEKGQQTDVFFGNGTKTKYTYDEIAHRLSNILTTKNMGAVKLQDVQYTYDAIGNITEVTDAAQEIKHFAGEEVKPVNKYVYDAVYRLIAAQGRKHAGQNAVDHIRSDFNYRNHPFIPNASPPPSANDANAFCNYREEYKYDNVDNMLEQKHIAAFNAFTRTFEYGDSGPDANNRLNKTSLGGFSFTYGPYDAHGNMPKMEHLPGMTWDYKDQLFMVERGGSRKAWYNYNAEGKRVRKVIEEIDGSRKERLYIGMFEIYREYDAGGAIQLVRESLSVMAGNNRIALAETKTRSGGMDIPVPETLQRYQYSNNLGSTSIELDDTAQLISYEEYFPFGTSSFSTVDEMREVPEKRYRYTSKERDGETGLYYHGARYYAPWLCRWISCDPAETADGYNVYLYCHNSPIAHHDPTGMLTWGQWAGIAAAVVVGTVVTVATAGVAGPVVGTVAAGIIGGIVGGAAGGAVGEAVEARIDHREAHIGRAALTGAVVGGVFAGGGAAVGAIARSAAGRAVGAAVGRSVVGAAGRAVGSVAASAGRAVSQSAVGQTVRAAASRVAGSVVGRAAAGTARVVSSGLAAIEGGAARVGQRIATATTRRGAGATYGSLSTTGYPGRTYMDRSLPEVQGMERVARSAFRARRADIRSFERAVEGLGKGRFDIRYLGAREVEAAGHTTQDILRGRAINAAGESVPLQVGSSVRDRTITILNPREAPAHVGVLTDEFMHAWNATMGRGSSLSGGLGRTHRALDRLLRIRGGSNELGQNLNMAFHKLEMLNFLESGAAIPDFMRRAGTPQQLREWARSFANDLARGRAGF